MVKKALALALAVSLASLMAVPKMEKVNKIAGNRNDFSAQSKGLTWAGTMGSTFDKSSNGYGWYQGYNRKIQTNHDPVTGHMVGSVYRKLADTGSGTIGGMIGEWSGTNFQGFAQTAYGSSDYQSGGSTTGAPGGRYPNTTEFINGYLFGLFNDFDVSTGGEISQAMYVVCDATFGWDESEWTPAKRIEATEGGATIPAAWTGIGDVVYNPVDGYYYWTSQWSEGLAYDSPYALVVGRTTTPADPMSWQWTDKNQYAFDTTTETGLTDMVGKWKFAYCKDIYGNGTGYGIGAAMIVDETFVMTNLAGDTLVVENNPRLGYVYTTNWGMDTDTGDIKANWLTPTPENNNFFIADVNKLFDWYNTEITDTVSVDSLGNATIATVPLNWPYIIWNIDAVATENNIVHVMVKVLGGSTESDYLYYANEEKFIGGFYDIVGEITPSGVIWHRANFIASFMGMDDGNTEWQYSNTHDLGIGYAGYGVVYATWIDRPETRYLTNPNTDPNKFYICDSYFTYSPDDGRTWDINKVVNYEGFDLHYAANITKTNTLQDEGFQVATHGSNVAGNMTVFAACQYYDPENPLAPPNADYYDYQQFLKVWKITNNPTTPTGFEVEEVSMVKDFSLMQNYPNPFNPSTEIRFALKNEGKVKLSVFNTKGELVANLKNEKMAKGMHSVNFDASDLNSGVYFYKLDVNGMAETKKMILTK
jgi:hypothetical protein